MTDPEQKKPAPPIRNLRESPRATEAERITRGVPVHRIIGRWPGDINDGFEEAIRRLRKGFSEDSR